VAVVVVRMRNLDVGMSSAKETRAAKDWRDRIFAPCGSSSLGRNGTGTAAGASLRGSAGTTLGDKPEHAPKAACNAATDVGASTRGKNGGAIDRTGADDGRVGGGKGSDAAELGSSGEESEVGKRKNAECHAAGPYFESARLHG